MFIHLSHDEPTNNLVEVSGGGTHTHRANLCDKECRCRGQANGVWKLTCAIGKRFSNAPPLPPLASNHFYRSLDRLQRSLAKHCGGGSKVGAIPKLDSQGTPERKGGRVLNKPCSSQKQPPPSHAHGLYLAATI